MPARILNIWPGIREAAALNAALDAFPNVEVVCMVPAASKEIWVTLEVKPPAPGITATEYHAKEDLNHFVRFVREALGGE